MICFCTKPTMTISNGLDQAKTRSSVLIDFLKVEVIDRNRNGSDLNAIATVTGFFTV